MNESSSEQQFHKSDAINFVCEKTGAIFLVLVGLMAGWQADEIQVKFKIKFAN